MRAFDSGHLGGPDRLPITAAARAEKPATVCEEAKRSAKGRGPAPVLIEPLRERVHALLTKPVRGATSYALSPAGRSAGHVDLIVKDNAIGIALTADAFWYEVVLTR